MTGEAATDDWRHVAACRDEDPDLFFSDGPAGAQARARQAKAICRHCPSLIECREWALRERPKSGIFGGLTAEQRREVHARTDKLGRQGTS
jgi:WhiB family redox-sensing transcriptional regulator